MSRSHYGLFVSWLAGRELAVTRLAGRELGVSWLSGRELAVSWLAGGELAVIWLAGRELAVIRLAGGKLAVMWLAGSLLAVIRLAGGELAGMWLACSLLAGRASQGPVVERLINKAMIYCGCHNSGPGGEAGVRGGGEGGESWAAPPPYSTVTGSDVSRCASLSQVNSLLREQLERATAANQDLASTNQDLAITNQDLVQSLERARQDAELSGSRLRLEQEVRER